MAFGGSLIIDRRQPGLNSTSPTTTTGTSGQTFTLAEIREISSVYPQDGQHPNFGEPVPLFPPGRIERMANYLQQPRHKSNASHRPILRSQQAQIHLHN